MTNLDKLPSYVLSSIKNALDYDEASDTEQAEILTKLRHSSVNEIFDYYLSWNGILGYTEQFIEALDSIRKAQEPNDTDLLVQYLWDVEYDSYMEEYDTDDPIGHALANPGKHIFCVLARLHMET
jgi:hypothetical protein